MATMRRGEGVAAVHLFKSSLSVGGILSRAAVYSNSEVVYTGRLSVIPFPSSAGVQPGVVLPDAEASGVRVTDWDSVAIVEHASREALAEFLRSTREIGEIRDALHLACGHHERLEFGPLARLASFFGWLSYRTVWQNMERAAIASGNAKVPPLEKLLAGGLAAAKRSEAAGYPEDPPEKRFQVYDYGGDAKVVENYEAELARRNGDASAPPKPKTMTTVGEVVNFHRFASTWLFGGPEQMSKGAGGSASETTGKEKLPKAAPGSPGETVGMFNLLKFRSNGGAESYQRYGREVTPYAIKRGGLPVDLVGFDLKQVRLGSDGELVDGEVEWSEMACMIYPSSYVFAEMAGSRGFKEFEFWRRGGLVDTTVIATFPEKVPKTFKSKL